MTQYRSWLALISVIALGAISLVALACNGGDEPDAAGPSVTPTPEVPAAPTPALDPAHKKIGEGTFDSTIIAGGVAGFDPLLLPLNTGVGTPPCAAFVFTFGWQVKDPYPPDGVNLIWRSTRMGNPEEVASGTSGTATVGCGFLEAVNRSGFTITVEAHYAMAEIQP